MKRRHEAPEPHSSASILARGEVLPALSSRVAVKATNLPARDNFTRAKKDVLERTVVPAIESDPILQNRSKAIAKFLMEGCGDVNTGFLEDM